MRPNAATNPLSLGGESFTEAAAGGLVRMSRGMLHSIAFFTVLAVLWEGSVRVFEIRSYLLPPLSAVVEELVRSRGLLWTHGIVTFKEFVLGFTAAAVSGVLMARSCFSFPSRGARSIHFSTRRVTTFPTGT